MWKIFLCYSIYLTIILLINLDQFARHCFNSLNPPQAWFGYSGHLHFQTKTVWVTCPRSHSQYQRRCSFSGFTDNNHLQHSVSFLKQNFSVCVLSPISLQPHRLQPARLLCPWVSPGKNTGVGCHFLLQETFPNLGIKPASPLAPPFQAGCLPSEPSGKM